MPTSFLPLWSSSGRAGTTVHICCLYCSVVGGWKAALVCTFAIFLLSFLIVLGALPFWNYLRNHPSARAALLG